MTKYIYSIIIPVYNAESTLVKCLDSIFNQKYTQEFEVIAIDDVSLDNSLRILREYQTEEPRLKILENKVNKGPALTRGAGTKAAAGKYIMHIDNDDWILPNAFERIYSIIKKHEPDVILLDAYVKYGNKEKRLKKFVNKEGFTQDKISILEGFYSLSSTKIMKKELSDDVLVFKENFKTTAEDFLFCLEILFKAKTFYCLPEAYYVWNINEGSLTKRTSKYDATNYQLDILHFTNLLLNKYDVDLEVSKKVISYRKKVAFNLAFDCYLDNTYDLIKKVEITEAFNQFNYYNDYQIENIKLILDNKFEMLKYTIRQRGFITVFKFILKYKILRAKR